MRHRMIPSVMFILALGLTAWLLYPAYQIDFAGYAIQFNMETEHDLNGVFGGEIAVTKQKISVQLHGKLNRYVLGKTADSCLLFIYVYVPRQTTFRLNDQALQSQKIAAFERDLIKPVLVKNAPDGRILSVSVDSSVSATAEMTLKNMISHFQFKANENAASTWESREDDAAGTLIAAYQTLPSNAPEPKYLKTKKQYLYLDGNFGGLGAPEVQVNSSEEMTRSTNAGEFRRILFREQKSLKLNGKPVGSGASYFLAQHIENKKLTGEPAKKIQNLPAETAYRVWAPLYRLTASDKMKLERQRALLRNTTLKGLCQKLDASRELQDSLYQQVVAMIIVSPASSAVFAKILEKDAPYKMRFYAISNAMAEVHSAECQKHLAEVLQARANDWPALYELLPLIAVMPKPCAAIELVVRKLAFESADENIRSTAQLALGGIAGNLRSMDPNRTNRITADLIKNLKGSVESQQYLLSLGNTGSVLALPEIREFLSSKDTEIVVTAVESLRFIENEEAGSIIGQLSRHKNKKIRQCAREVMTIRKEQKADI